MIGRVLVAAGNALCRRRDHWFVGQLNRALQILYFKTENENFDLEVNGEGRLIRLLARPDVKTIVDVGANHGDWSLAVKKYLPDARIHAFEASPATFRETQKALARYPDIKINNVGLYDRPGQMTFYHSAENDGRSSLIQESVPAGATKLTVDVTTLDDYATAQGLTGIDLLKIDTEGAEYAILEGARGLMSKGAIKVVQFEYGFVSVDTGRLLKSYYELLTAHGFVLGKMYPTSIDFRDYDRTMENFIGPNFVAVRKDLTDVIASLRSPSA
jgi:FkbM family methyltransferase